MNRKRKLGFIAFMIAFVALAIGSAMFNQGTVKKVENPTATLSDGRKIELISVTFGTNHSVTVPAKWNHPMAPLVPDSLLPAFGVRPKRYHQTEQNEVLLPWLIVPRKAGSRSNLSLGAFKVVTDSGAILQAGGRSTSSMSDGSRLVRTTIQAFPRRDEFFSLTGAVDKLPFSIRIKNPIFGRTFPTWTADKFPATNATGDYRFVLPPPTLHEQSQGGYLSSKLKIFHQTRRVDHWFNTTLELSDPTGNRAFFLSTNERQWKTHFKMWKTYAGPWSTNDFREFHLSNLPEDASYELFPINTIIRGFRIGRVWLGGPGQYEFNTSGITNAVKLTPGAGPQWSSRSSGSGWSMKWAQHEHWLLAEMDRWPRRNERVSIFVRDKTGKEVQVESRGWSGSGGVKFGTFLLKPTWADIRAARKKPSKSDKLKDLVAPPFTIRFGIQTNLQTEFIVDITKLPRSKR